MALDPLTIAQQGIQAGTDTGQVAAQGLLDSGTPPDAGDFTICGDYITARFTYPASLSLPWGLTKRTN